ncbi:predicted protein [Sclerotinia sclerotiorum 1980 UF-70]|uniref:Uncharacterized protein n=1 Tax=Sclerotinia sclerotiorum (strain ATCC 18683 / 1980 / Ss-1) TaxID=665079 RepID=A7EZY4_SCLS1|nr:predicted protein [Sclerotinia sclerotiorum 1980 UF-70]EDN95026.1 predicted protein [Sclerotinia sclerotiorum 1980 UF-70]
MAGRYNESFSSLPVDFTSYPSPVTSQYPNYQYQSGTQGYSMQHSQGEPAIPYHEYGQTASVYQENDQRDNLSRNSGFSLDTLYSQGTAFPLPHGVGQTSLSFCPQYNHGSYMGNVPYDQGPINPSQDVFGQVVTPIRQHTFMPQENNNHPRCQFNTTPQRYVHYHNPLYGFSPDAQSGASFNNTASPLINSTVSAPANSMRPEYKTPPRLVTPGASNSYGECLMTLSNQYPLGVQVNNGFGQILANTPVPRTPQSTPAGLSDRIHNATPDNNYITIKRKPAMRPKNDPIHAEDVMHGSIVWLSKHQGWHEPIICVQNHECNDKVKEIDGHNHPVMILRINQRHGSDIIGDIVLDIAIMTTLCGLSLHGYVQKLRTLGPDTSKQWYLQETMPLSQHRSPSDVAAVALTLAEVASEGSFDEKTLGS